METKMKRKLFIILSLLSFALIGTVAALPALYRPRLPGVVVDGAMRTEAIDKLVTGLSRHYVFPDTAKQIGTLLRKRQHDGKYDAMASGEKFAAQLTADMASVAHDLHMKVKFSQKPMRSDRELDAMTNAASQAARDRKYGVGNVDHLSPAIGYLRLSAFPPSSLVAKQYASAMDRLSDTNALIIDVRDNRGGSPGSVALLVSYFVDHRTRLNDIWSRDSGVTTQIWTEDKLDGRRYGGKKPVVILAGPGTASAGEDFTYTMQALKRATVIGEPIWGGAHPIALYRLGDHFFAAIPNSRSISPITHTNWEGSGVTPDVTTPPANALAVAQELLQRQLDAVPTLRVENRIAPAQASIVEWVAPLGHPIGDVFAMVEPGRHDFGDFPTWPPAMLSRIAGFGHNRTVALSIAEKEAL
jgi:retinol-binding protein 3